MKRILALGLALLAGSTPAFGGDVIAYQAKGEIGTVGWEVMMVWGQGEYLLDLWARTDRGTTNFARNRDATEAALELRREAVFLQSVAALPLSSRETAGARMKTDPALVDALRALVARSEKRQSALSEDMEDVRLRYVVPVYGPDGLLSVFAPRGAPSPLERYLGFAPAAAYTGLVIQVQGERPAYGRSAADATLKICLFPRIYDSDLRLILDPVQVDREKLLSWGAVAYSNDLDELAYHDRVGENPLRTVARGIYGVGDTDIVLSREMARLLLSRDENLALLREGRVLVVLDAPAAPEPEPDPSEHEGVLEILGPVAPAPAEKKSTSSGSSGH